MRTLAETLTVLREVREACRLFLTMSALEVANRAAHAGEGALDRALDQIAADIERCAAGLEDDAGADPRLADPHDRDWSVLYRGSVLDD